MGRPIRHAAAPPQGLLQAGRPAVADHVQHQLVAKVAIRPRCVAVPHSRHSPAPRQAQHHGNGCIRSSYAHDVIAEQELDCWAALCTARPHSYLPGLPACAAGSIQVHHAHGLVSWSGASLPKPKIRWLLRQDFAQRSRLARHCHTWPMCIKAPPLDAQTPTPGPKYGMCARSGPKTAAGATSCGQT